MSLLLPEVAGRWSVSNLLGVGGRGGGTRLRGCLCSPCTYSWLVCVCEKYLSVSLSKRY